MLKINIGTIIGGNNQLGESNKMILSNSLKDHETEIFEMIEKYHRSPEEKTQLQNSLLELNSEHKEKQQKAASLILKFIKDVGIELIAVVTVKWLESLG